MKHKIGYNRLGRKPAHRKALERGMVTSLLRHERIRTTGPKAKELRRKAEKLITRAKVDTVHNRRIASQIIKDRAVLSKLFTDIGPRFLTRPGGYTRILKLGRRQGDAAEIVLLALVEETSQKEEKRKPRRRKSETKQQPAKKDTATTETQQTVSEDTGAEATDSEEAEAKTEKAEPKKAAASQQTATAEKTEESADTEEGDYFGEEKESSEK